MSQTDDIRSDDDEVIGALLAELDDPPHTADQPRYRSRARRGWARRGLRIAGAAATLAVAAAALVLPASPLHHWIAGPAASPPADRGTPAAPPAAMPASGIAVPASGSLTIVFRHEQAQGAIDLAWTVTGDATFGSRGGTTAYHVGSGQVSIDNKEPANAYQISVPRSVRELRVVVGKRVLLQWPEDSARYTSAARPDRIHLRLDGSGVGAP